MVRVGIIGASGYTGAELLRLSAQHPEIEVVCATGDSQAGTLASMLYPSLAGAYPNLVFEEFSADRFVGLDAVFLGVPHEAALEIAPQLVGKVGVVIDLSAAYRLKNASLYPQWYGFEHTQPDLLAQAVYGLPELYRSQLVGAKLIATPGCYVTAASLALTPLVRSGIVSPTGVIVDAASGVSGAGRALKHSSMFSTIDEDFTAYGLLDHRHTPEIEQALSAVGKKPAKISFTPILAPMPRGILSTITGKLIQPINTQQAHDLFSAHYAEEFFVDVLPLGQMPKTSAVTGSNKVQLQVAVDENTNRLIVSVAIDNLGKGAAGQAIQNANLICGIAEISGLALDGIGA